jgi:putative ABC transport system substrate-binding protein
VRRSIRRPVRHSSPIDGAECANSHLVHRIPNVKRRSFICWSGSGLVSVALHAAAQPTRVARVGLLHNANAKLAAPSVDAFRGGLQAHGWIEGQNIAIEYRWADGNMDQVAALAKDLVHLPLAAIVTAGPRAIRALREASSTMPIVAAIMPDPVAEGFAVSLARPGGNVTGLANLFEDLTPKQLQIFKEMLPGATRVALLSDPQMGSVIQLATEAAARSLGIESRVFQIRAPDDLDTAIGQAKSEDADGVHVLPSPFFDRNRERIASLAAHFRLPTISESALYVRDGGLMSYGPSFPAMWRHGASYVDRILRGAKPGDLPIEQPTEFELVVNLKTARAIGLSVPQTILLRADSVLE